VYKTGEKNKKSRSLRPGSHCALFSQLRGMQEKLDSSCNLTRAQAASTNIYMSGSAVDDSLDASDIGLPSSVCSSVGVGNLDAECYALFTDITLCHFSAPPYNKLHNKDYNNTTQAITQEKFREKIKFLLQGPVGKPDQCHAGGQKTAFIIIHGKGPLVKKNFFFF